MPLYTSFNSDLFEPPQSVSMNCSACGKETTWQLEYNMPLTQATPTYGFIVTYICGLCGKERLIVIIRTVELMKHALAPAKIQKIGQFPPQTIDIARDLEERLGDSARFYKNALTCRNVNFGIGALAYIRRVVEDKTNELIDVVAEQAESYGTDKEVVDAIRAAKDDRMPFDQRLHLASEAIPSTLRIDGANPLAALYSLMSAGLHAQSDEDCIGIFGEIQDVFEYVFARLRAEVEDRNRMMSKVKRLFGGKKESKASSE
jgi:hypothetical protein